MTDDIKTLQLDTSTMEVEIPLSLKGGVYANTITVTSTNSEITLNFIYVNPNDKPVGTLVSRVIVPIDFVNNLATIMTSLKRQIKEMGEKLHG
jgi:hypothetical protein